MTESLACSKQLEILLLLLLLMYGKKDKLETYEENTSPHPASNSLTFRHPTPCPQGLPGEVQRISRLRVSSAAAGDAMEGEQRQTSSEREYG